MVGETVLGEAVNAPHLPARGRADGAIWCQPPANATPRWRKRGWIDRRIAELIGVGTLPDDARSQAEGEWRIGQRNRRDR